MKKTFPLIVLMLCLFLFACKKDKNSKASTGVSIVGTWTLASNIISHYDKDGKLVSSDDYSAAGGTVTFNADGTATATRADGGLNHITYVVSTANSKKTIRLAIARENDSDYIEVDDLTTLTDHNLEFQFTTTDIPPGAGYTKAIEIEKYIR